MLTTTARGGRHRRALGTVLTVLVAALGLLLGGAGPAAAHAKIIRTSPAENAVVKAGPKAVTLTFTESMALSDGAIRVFAPDGKRLATGKTGRVDGAGDTARVTLPAGLAEGTYTVSWKAVSADTHPVSGAFVFSIGKASGSRAVLPDESPGGGLAGFLFGVARLLAYGGYAVLTGAGAFVLLCRAPGAVPRPLLRLLARSWGVLLLSVPAQLVLRAPYESGDGLGEAVNPAAFLRTLGSDPGRALLARLALVTVAGAYVALLSGRGPLGRHLPRVPRPALTASGALLAAGLAGTWALAEHASAGPQVALAMPVAVVHLVATALWLGGLAALLTSLFRAGAESGELVDAEAVRRFSRLASGAVVALAATGVYQSWRQVGSWEALVSTSYGRLLIVKVCAVAAMLAAASYSRRLVGAPRTVPARAAARTPGKGAVTAGGGARPGQTAAQAAALTRRATETVRTGSGPGRAEKPGTARPGAKPGAVRNGKGGNGGRGTGDCRAGGAPLDRRALLRSVGVEVAVAVAVLGVTTVLTGTEPGREAVRTAAAVSTAAAAPALPGAAIATVPFDTGAPDGRGKGKVLVTADPGTTGINTLTALTYGPDGGLASVPEVRVAFTLPARGLGPIDVPMKNPGGYWAADDFQLPMAGEWKISVTVRTSDTEQDTGTATIRIR